MSAADRKQFRLPDDSGVKPNQQRDAANSRWSSGKAG